eukprot:TRINITY_DN10792_c0_g1_i1.p1 TRINITY_DN10792_c0_g1~~TRINITY_DN10792_c0_g1_i1.p1  ORF type:complete len:198 (-),score=26.48 TRINITY_DN10792_c0_g1_i1:75-668(-)
MAETPECVTDFTPPQRTSPEVEEWGTTTTIGLLAGMMYGGMRQAAMPPMRMTEIDAVLPPLRRLDLPPSPPAPSVVPPSSSASGAAPQASAGAGVNEEARHGSRGRGFTTANRRIAMEQRLLQISKGTVRGGCQLGALTGLFSGVQLAMGLYRERKDTLNTVTAAAVTAAALGLASKGERIPFWPGFCQPFERRPSV